jgi:hypothetical protein
MGLTITILTFVVGLAVLTGGAHWFVHGAVRLTKVLRVSQLVIGLPVEQGRVRRRTYQCSFHNLENNHANASVDLAGDRFSTGE